MTRHDDGRDLERELVEGYPELALLLQRTATMHAWQPSAIGEAVLHRLAEAVAVVLERRLSPAEANQVMGEVVAETQEWLVELNRQR